MAPNDIATDSTQVAPAIPDLSGLASPAQPAPPVPDTGSTQPAAVTQMSGYVDKANAAGQKAADIANTPTVNPTVPHARLLSMVQGLADGLGAFGTAIATHGKEGGAPEVQQLEGERQQQKIQAQQAAQAQKNQQIQQQLMVSDTNMKLANNVMLMATLPNELAKSDVELKGATQNLAENEANFRAQHGGMNAMDFNKALGDPTPVAQGQGPANSFFVNSAKQQLQASSSVLGTNDPYVQNLQTTLADPKATPKDLWTATSQLQAQQAKQSDATKQRAEKETADSNSPVAKLATPEALAAPGAQAAIQAKIADPKTDPNDLPRLRALLPQAAVAQLNAETIKKRELSAQQTVNQGDPDTAGQLLASRALTLSELKTRPGSTPKFVEDAVLAAQKYDPTYKAAEAEGQAKVAGSAANQQFFGNTDSLLVKGGTLDQLATAGGNLGNGPIPALNTLENARKAALGQGPQAAFAAAALGVADDYSKVMSGRAGSDTARQQALDIINANQSPAGRAAALNQIRQAVSSQRQGRVGTNPYMRDMYPDPSTTRSEASNYVRPANVTPQAILMSVPGGQPHWIEPQNQKAAQNAGAVAVQ